MTTRFTFSRFTDEDFDSLNEMYQWCKKTFNNQYTDWTVQYGSTEVEACFVFYNEEAASLFALKYV